MSDEQPILNYESPHSTSTESWECFLRSLSVLAGAAACVLSCAIIFATFNARIVLATSRDGGRSQAWAALDLGNWALLLVALFWLGARRNRTACRVARTSFLIAAIWLLYVKFMVHGGKGQWYW